MRVADFGLARALAEASWTEPSGAVFGTARYASPEQAMGVQLDARSDLYSLALVIIESVTGRVPFSADTTIGMLTARTQRSLTAPDEVGPLAPIVERAGRIDVSERYPDAATMRAALVDVGESLPPPGPLPLAGMIDGPDPHPTRTQAPEATAALFDQDADAVAVVAEVHPKIRQKLDSRRLVPFFVAAALVLVIAMASVALAKVGGGTQVEVPGLVGYSLEVASAAGRRAGIHGRGLRRAARARSGRHDHRPEPERRHLHRRQDGERRRLLGTGADRDPGGREPAAGRRRERVARARASCSAKRRRNSPTRCRVAR